MTTPSLSINESHSSYQSKLSSQNTKRKFPYTTQTYTTPKKPRKKTSSILSKTSSPSAPTHYLTSKTPRPSLSLQSSTFSLQTLFSQLSNTLTTPSLTSIPYWSSTTLPIISKATPHILLRLINSNVDLCTCANTFVLTKTGLPCSMRNTNRSFTAIGRQQITEQFTRPNDIMLFPTDPSISRSHFKLFQYDLFTQYEKYKVDIDLINRANHSKTCTFKLPVQIWYMVMSYLKPQMKMKVVDNSTIYGTYIKVKEPSMKDMIFTLYTSLTTHAMFYNEMCLLCKYIDNDYMQMYITNYLFKYNITLNTSLDDFVLKLHNHLVNVFPYEMVSPFSNDDAFSKKTLFTKHNHILRKDQVYLTSPQSGFIIINISSLDQVIPNLNFISYQTRNITIISTTRILSSQNRDMCSHLFRTAFNMDGVFDIEEYFHKEMKTLNINAREYVSLVFVETEGDPCGVMNRVNVVMLVDCIRNTGEGIRVCGYNGFLFGKDRNKKGMIGIGGKFMECEVFFYYERSLNEWSVWDVSGIGCMKDEERFGLWECTAKDKRDCNRFEMMRNGYDVGDGDQIRISESVFEVEYRLDGIDDNNNN